MIIIKNRELLIPANERYLGTNYDTGMENRVFRLARYSQSGTDLEDLTFSINLFYDGIPLDRAELQKVSDDTYIYLTWTITAVQVSVTGTVFACVTGNDTNDTVKWSSFQAAFYTEKSLGEDYEVEIRELIKNLAKETDNRIAGDLEEKTAREAADINESDARQAAVAEVSSRIAQEASARESSDVSLQAQINQIVAPQGDAPSAAEVENARIGADGITYSSLGNAIRTQVINLQNDFMINAANILDNYNKSGRTVNGVTFAWNGNKCIISGTSIGEAFCNIYANASALPIGVTAGGKIYPGLLDQNIARLQIYSFDSNGNGTLIYNSQASYNTDFIVVPINAIGMSVRIWVQSNVTLSETVYPYVSIAPSNHVLDMRTADLSQDQTAYLASTGDSTDRSSEIQALLNTHGRVILGSGDFYISGYLNVPARTTLEGLGSSTRIVSNGTNVTSIVLNSKSTVKNLWLDGGLAEAPSVDEGGNRYGIYVNGVTDPFWIRDVIVSGFSNIGVYIGNTGGASVPHFVDNVFIYACFTGFETINSEYGVYNNIVARACYRGCLELGGNNKYTNCGFDSNSIGIQMTPTYENNAHGCFVGCSINHSSEYALYSVNANNGELFDSCQIHFGVVHIGGSSAVQFHGCQFGNGITIEKSGNGNAYFRDNIHYADPTITNSGTGNLVFTDCVNFVSGNVVDVT